MNRHLLARIQGTRLRLSASTDREVRKLLTTATGEAASTNVVDRPMPGTMTGYAGPEKTRSAFRRKQKEVPVSRRGTEDVLQALRTQGKF